MSKHTPGPWRRIGRAIEATCNKWDVRIGAARLYINQTSPAVTQADLETAEANAQLMAAAPELFAACEEAIRILETAGLEHVVAYNMLCDAIEKATPPFYP